jgi:hypothetical protein
MLQPCINGPIGADPSLVENGLGFNGLKYIKNSVVWCGFRKTKTGVERCGMVRKERVEPMRRCSRLECYMRRCGRPLRCSISGPCQKHVKERPNKINTKELGCNPSVRLLIVGSNISSNINNMQC